MKPVRYRALLCVLLLIGLALTACGKESAVNTPTESEEVQTTATETLSEEDQILSAISDKDFGEAEITVYGYSSSQSYNDSEFYTAEQTGELIDDALYSRNLITEQRLNIKLVYNCSKGEQDALNSFQNSVLAGDNIADDR